MSTLSMFESVNCWSWFPGTIVGMIKRWKTLGNKLPSLKRDMISKIQSKLVSKFDQTAHCDVLPFQEYHLSLKLTWFSEKVIQSNRVQSVLALYTILWALVKAKIEFNFTAFHEKKAGKRVIKNSKYLNTVQ